MSTSTLPKNWKTPFFSIWIGQIFSLVGSRLAQFALVWWLTDTTNSPTVLATSTLVAVLPGIVLGPIAGPLVDRWNRRIVMIVADSFVALVSLWLALLFWNGSMQVWHVYLAMLARSIGGAFHWPSMQASTSLMVPKEHLSRVAGLNQTLQGALTVVAPPLGALLLGLMPLHGVMAIDVVTALIAISPLFFVRIPQPQPNGKEAEEKSSVWQDFKAGIAYVRGWPGMVAVMVMAMIINFVINPAFSLMPLLVKNHFGGGPMELGGMESAWGVGMLLGGITLSVWGGFKRKVFTSLSGLVLGGISVSLVGLAPGNMLWLAISGLFLAGFMNPLINGPLFALLQTVVAPEMQGRVFTLVGSLSQAMMPLSLAVAGPVSEAIGIRTWYLVGGLVFAGIGAIGFLIPALVNLENNNGHNGAKLEPAVSTVSD